MSDAIKSMKEKGDMSAELAQRLTPQHSVSLRIYGLPKLHKSGVPMRPIPSMIRLPSGQDSGVLDAYYFLTDWKI